MPVELSAVPEVDEFNQQPPRLIVWGLLFLVVIGIGFGLALWFWPPGSPRAGFQFWVWAIVVPALVFTALFVFRLCLYNLPRFVTWIAAAHRTDVVRTNISYAQEPLACLGLSYLTGLGAKELAVQVLKGDVAVRPHPGPKPEQKVKCAPLTQIQSEDGSTAVADRLPVLFSALLAPLVPPLIEAMKTHRVDVFLCLDPSLDEEALSGEWLSIWQKAGLPAFRHSAWQPAGDLGLLDTWLDAAEADTGHLVLLVSAYLMAEKVHAGGEMGIAILCGWPGRTEKLPLKPMAWVHRPVWCLPRLASEAAAKAVLWGRARLPEIEYGWLAGLSPAMHAAVTRALSGEGGENTDLMPINNLILLDGILGEGHVAAPWTSLGLAIEQARTGNKVQLVGSIGEEQLAMSIVRPAGAPQEHS